MAKYRVSANLVWDMDGNDSKLVEQEAMERLIGMAKSAGVRLRNPKLSLNKLKELNSSTTLAEYPPDEILKLIARDGHRREFTIGDAVYRVKMNSQRYFTFQENKKCVACGVEGTKILLELPNGCEYPHFNLYAEENGENVLMTKDHKIPVARGGKDVMENYQTKCAICNNIKGKDILHLDDLKVLRELHNKCVAEHMSSTQLHQVVQEEKVRLMTNRTSSVSTIRQVVVANKKTSLDTNAIYRFTLISVISVTAVGVAVFNPFYAVVTLVTAILGYSAGKLR